MIDHDYELEKSIHPENFEDMEDRGDDSTRDEMILDDELADYKAGFISFDTIYSIIMIVIISSVCAFLFIKFVESCPTL